VIECDSASEALRLVARGGSLTVLPASVAHGPLCAQIFGTLPLSLGNLPTVGVLMRRDTSSSAVTEFVAMLKRSVSSQGSLAIRDARGAAATSREERSLERQV
jgi:DNA-binding transcriptional LysR family regulator